MTDSLFGGRKPLQRSPHSMFLFLFTDVHIQLFCLVDPVFYFSFLYLFPIQSSLQLRQKDVVRVTDYVSPMGSLHTTFSLTYALSSAPVFSFSPFPGSSLLLKMSFNLLLTFLHLFFPGFKDGTQVLGPLEL